jgi:hypothetical protein
LARWAQEAYQFSERYGAREVAAPKNDGQRFWYTHSKIERNQ